MKILEKLVYKMLEKAKENRDELKVLNKEIQLPNLPFKRITYDKAIIKLNDENVNINWSNLSSNCNHCVYYCIPNFSQYYCKFFFISKTPTNGEKSIRLWIEI